MISLRGQALKPSPTLAMANRARELAVQGKPVISLTVGEPDWPTLAVAADAAVGAIKAGKTKYTPAHGTPELRKALIPWIQEETGIAYTDSEIVVGTGAKFVIAAALQMLVNPGDEVIIPTPYWVSYPVMAELAGGVPKIVECGASDNFKMTASALEGAINPKTKVLILCGPSNPTGISYSRKELRSIADMLVKHPQVIVISDDIYNRLMLDGSGLAPHLLQVEPALRDRVICVNGASKAFSMTGWRVGWAAGPLKLMKVMADYFSQTTSNPCSISQAATLAAVEQGRPELQEKVRELARRCELGLAALATVPGLKVAKPDGAFYFWVDVSAWFGKVHKASGKKVTNSKEVAELLLDHCFLAVVPGVEFGAEGYLRLSFATSEKNFAEACSRMRELGSSLEPATRV